MLKLVPDPPRKSKLRLHNFVPDEYRTLCAETVAHQALLLQSHTPAMLLNITSKHAPDTQRKPVNPALAHIPIPANPQTLH